MNLEKLLKDTPGNDELNKRWNWGNCEKVFISPESSIAGIEALKIPGIQLRGQASPQPPLFIVLEANKLKHFCNQDENTIACAKVADPMFISGFDTFKNLPIPFKLIVSRNEESNAILYESMILHERLHNDSGALEFGAFRQQINYLSEQKLIAPIKDDDVLKLILNNYSFEVFVTSVFERFDGKVSVELRSWLPGGTKFIQAVKDIEKQRDQEAMQGGQQEKEIADNWKLRMPSMLQSGNTEIEEVLIHGARQYYIKEFIVAHSRRTFRSINELGQEIEAWENKRAQLLEELQKDPTRESEILKKSPPPLVYATEKLEAFLSRRWRD